jgi:hypothetical protein
MSKLNIICLDFKPLRENTLIGFAAIKVTEMRLTIRDVAIHEKGESRWAQLPSKPQISRDGKLVTKDGKGQYTTILEFDSRAVREAFSNAVIASVLDRVPNAFVEEVNA